MMPWRLRTGTVSQTYVMWVALRVTGSAGIHRYPSLDLTCRELSGRTLPRPRGDPCYIEISSTPTMSDIPVRIIVEILSVFAPLRRPCLICFVASGDETDKARMLQ